ncbi:MAG: hypothetical protein WC859_10530 [Elusimicrobiota bacterium]
MMYALLFLAFFTLFLCVALLRVVFYIQRDLASLDALASEIVRLRGGLQ